MVIITGTGRSGTATLARILGGHHEYRVAYILEKYFLKADPHSDPFATLEDRVQVMLDLHQGVDRGSFVDASNLYVHFLDAVYLLNPSVKCVLSVRNGKDFVRSAFTRGWHSTGSFGTSPPREDPYFPVWDTMSPLQRNAWIWAFRNRRALAGFDVIPETQKLIVKIEELGRPEVLDRLEYVTGIKVRERRLASEKCNANPSLAFPPQEEWTPEMNTEFDEIAGAIMKFFHYE